MNDGSQNINHPHESGIGPIVGSLIIVVVLMIAALYVWGQHLNTEARLKQQAADQANISTTTTVIYSTSTIPADIQKDLNASPIIKSPGF
jgi:hypothetical protein